MYTQRASRHFRNSSSACIYSTRARELKLWKWTSTGDNVNCGWKLGKLLMRSQHSSNCHFPVDILMRAAEAPFVQSLCPFNKRISGVHYQQGHWTTEASAKLWYKCMRVSSREQVLSQHPLRWHLQSGNRELFRWKKRREITIRMAYKC